MTLEEYYNNTKIVVGSGYETEMQHDTIADYMSSYEMTEDDLIFLNALGYSAVDFIDDDMYEEGSDEYYENNDLLLLIDKFYDEMDADASFLTRRDYTKNGLERKLHYFQESAKELEKIISNMA